MTFTSSRVIAMPSPRYALYQRHEPYEHFKSSDEYCKNLFLRSQWRNGRICIASIAAVLFRPNTIAFLCQDTRGRELCLRRSPPNISRWGEFWMSCRPPDMALTLNKRMWSVDGWVQVSKGFCLPQLFNWREHLLYRIADCVETVINFVTDTARMIRNRPVPQRYNIFAWTTRGVEVYRASNEEKGIDNELFEVEYISLTPLVADKQLRDSLTITNDKSSAIFDEHHILGVNYRACARSAIPFILHIAAIPLTVYQAKGKLQDS